MICKFFRGGRTYAGAKSAVNYLLNERVENGEAKVLVGNPQLTLDIIKNIKNKWKFSSGVMSFKENINDKTKQEIIKHFKDTFFCGMNEEQYNLLIVEHKDKGRTELHFIIPRVELTTGKAYNPYFVKKDFTKKDLFQDFINAKYNLSSPHYAEKQELTKLPNPNWKKQELQEWIDRFIIENIEQGLINNADDVKYFLEQAGFAINRQGKDYIGLELEGKKIRMKGVVYGKNFRDIAEIARTAETREREHSAITREEFAELEQKLDRIIRKQAEYNQKRYARDDKKESKEGVGRDRQHDVVLQADNKMAINSTPDSAYDRRSNGVFYGKILKPQQNISPGGNRNTERKRDKNTMERQNEMGRQDKDDNYKERRINDRAGAEAYRRIGAEREARNRTLREIRQAREAVYRQNRAERNRIFEELTENSGQQQTELGNLIRQSEDLIDEVDTILDRVKQLIGEVRDHGNRFIDEVEEVLINKILDRQLKPQEQDFTPQGRGLRL